MASPFSQADFEATLGRWPRRLLHVPTMTSYCWQPGNIYGTFQAPLYNAMTYTWGRWMLHSPDDHSHVQALDIKGVGWKIPRVDPEHFSREDFLAAIEKAIQPVPSYQELVIDGQEQERAHETRELQRPVDESYQDDVSHAIEFLWLDIACIDQRPNSSDSSAEIGRQGDIFRGAQRVLVWLTSFSRIELGNILTNVSIPDGSNTDSRLPRLLSTIQDHLEMLCSDPWFSSLWTLQEAFLRPDAIFLSRDGQFPGGSEVAVEHGQRFPFNLKFFAWICRDLVRFINEDIWDVNTETTVDASKRHQNLVDRIGITGFSQSPANINPLKAFVASAQRITSREPDRVYGIQQIFGFRLGSTALDAPQRSFTRQDLELQLGKEILARFPLMSQLYVSTRPVEFGDGWRISPSSMIEFFPMETEWSEAIVEERDGKYRQERKITRLCTLGTQTVDNHTWGYFIGKAIPFNSLVNCVENLTSEAYPNAMLRCGEFSGETEETEAPLDLLLLFLDSSDHTAGWPTQERPAAWKGEGDFVGEAEGCRWLADQFPLEDLIILGLASFSIRAFGLILLRDHTDSEPEQGSHTYWRRLGYCEWWMVNLLSDGDLRPETSFASDTIEAWEGKYGPCLRGKSDDWFEAEGLFG